MMRNSPLRPHTRRSLVLAVGCLAVLVLVPGCGSRQRDEGSLSGKVSFRGGPVTGGGIILYPTEPDRPLVLGRINPDGTYVVGRVPCGKWQVAIETESMKKTSVPKPPGKQPPAGVSCTPPPVPNPAALGNYVKIPLRYANPQKSGLVVDVSRGNTVQNFDLSN